MISDQSCVHFLIVWLNSCRGFEYVHMCTCQYTERYIMQEMSVTVCKCDIQTWLNATRNTKYYWRNITFVAMQKPILQQAN